MTAQVPERLSYNGKQVPLYTQPLREYLKLSGADPGFRSGFTCLWRGYIGSWELVGGRLFLTSLKGSLKDGSKASLSTVFPDASGRIPAHWYSGLLRIPQGRRLKYAHIGSYAAFERYLLVEISRGFVAGARTEIGKEKDLDDDEIPF